jgi:hypothetical protein
MTPQQILNALFVTALYDVAFDRVPDAEGFAWWMKDLDNGQSFADVAASFSPHIPAFTYATTESTIDMFSMNAFNHEASDDVQNHWQVMAVNAVPSHALLLETALYVIGQPLDSWAYPIV